MSRLSRVPRQSLFPPGSQTHKSDDHIPCSANLFECVQNLADVCAETHDAQNVLRNGTYDLKRMSRVLENQRVFLFVNESTVRKYKEDLTEEIEPQILELVERAKKGLKSLERKKQTLQTKAGHVPVAKAATQRSAAARIEERRLQLLSRQRQALELDLKKLQDEISALETNYDMTA